MADLLTGYMPVIEQITGQNIYIGKGLWDGVICMNTTHVANQATAESLAIDTITGLQLDGRYMITMTDDISGWTQAVDRCQPQIGAAYSSNATLAGAWAAGSGTGASRLLVGFSTTDDNSTWDESIGSTTAGDSVFGVLADKQVSFIPAINGFYQPYGDISGITTPIAIENITITVEQQQFSRGINCDSTGAASAGISINRCRFIGLFQGIQTYTSVHAGEVIINSCEFERCLVGVDLNSAGALNINNITSSNCQIGFQLRNKAHTVVNCAGINNITDYSLPASATIITSRSMDGTAGTQITLPSMKTHNTESYGTARPAIYSPKLATSNLIGTGTAITYGYDTHGKAFETPPCIGASELYALTDPQYVTEAGGGNYHEVLVAEALLGVVFGNLSGLTGTSRNTDPGVANVKNLVTYYINSILKTGSAVNTDPGEASVIKDITYYIDSILKTGTFDEASRNTDPGEASVIKDVAYIIQNVAKTGSFDEAARNTDPGIASVIKDVSYIIQNAAKVGTFDEAARNTDPGIALVKLLTDYKILNVAKQGTYAPAGTPPTEPTLTVKDNEDGTATITISGSDAGTTNDVYVKKVGAAWSATPTFTKTGDGSSIETLASGFYYAKVESEGAGGVSPGEDDPVAFEMSSTTNYTAEYRVTGIESMGGSGMKRCVLERIEHPINPNVP